MGHPPGVPRHDQRGRAELRELREPDARVDRDLEAEVARGAFRQDLFFRLNGISLTIPPLRERQTEIRPLAEIFVAHACAEAGRPVLPLSLEAMALMHRHSWPGNIRELKHMMERAVLLCQDDAITPEHLPVERMRATRPAPHAHAAASAQALPDAAAMPGAPQRVPTGGRRPTPRTPSQDDTLDVRKDARERERKQIIAALRTAEGNQSKAARILGISRRTLLTKLDVHKLPRPRKRH